MGFVSPLLLAILVTGWLSAAWAAPPAGLAQGLRHTIAQARRTLDARRPNEQAPELGPEVRKVLELLEHDPAMIEAAKSDPAFRALRTQVINNLTHVSFSFDSEAPSYPHERVLDGPYPRRPTLGALEKAADFLDIVADTGRAPPPPLPVDAIREKQLMDDQKAQAKKIVDDAFGVYDQMRARLEAEGPDASFKEEFGSLVEYLELKIRSDAAVAQLSRESKVLGAMQVRALEALQGVKGILPYMKTLDAVERSLEYLDVVYRVADPQRSPVLYHSGRYEYYNHFLKAEIPEHVIFPTLASLGATDILKARGAPIAFVGANTDIAYVDGYYQTPFEFYIHDINHSRRMYQFFKEQAKARGMSVREYARQSDRFMREKLLPLITISKGDSDAVKNAKRLRKVLLFEILHEDALPADLRVIQDAVLRPPSLLTPFEKIVNTRTGKKVVYVMEPGATTLAYVYRKLAHDFYDMPGERVDNIVAPEYRTQEHIVAAAEDVFKMLGLPYDRKTLAYYAVTDEGFPSDFRGTLVRDHARREKETLPLISRRKIVPLAMEELRAAADPSLKIDYSQSPEVASFFRNGDRISVNLRVPTQDGKTIDYQVSVPQERVGTDEALGTLAQIKGTKNVIQVRSGRHLGIPELKKAFLARLSPSDHWVVVRDDDPKAVEIAKAAAEMGFETITLARANQALRSGADESTLYAVLADQAKLEEAWARLADNEMGTGAHHVSLDFRKVNKGALATLGESLAHSRSLSRRWIEAKLGKAGVPVIPFRDVDKTFGGMKPLLIGGPAEVSWKKMSANDKREATRAVNALLKSLDPSKAYLILSDTQLGLNRVVYRAARQNGIKILAAVPERHDAGDLAPVDAATIVGSSWAGKSRPVLQHVKARGGAAYFVGGGAYIAAEIQLARDLGVDLSVMKGPTGAANDAAARMPERAFEGADGLVTRVYAEQGELIRPDKAKDARDAHYRDYVKKLKSTGTKLMSYPRLVEAAKGRNVVVLGGYSGLGYKDPQALRAQIRELVRTSGDGALYVIGGTGDGIGQAYSWIPSIARELGFKDVKTAGILTRNGAKLGIAPQDYVVFVDTAVDDWKASEGGRLFRVDFAHDTGGKMVFFQGGAITDLEAREAAARGVDVTVVRSKELAPDPKRVDKALKANPGAVVDGTEALVKAGLGVRCLDSVSGMVAGARAGR